MVNARLQKTETLYCRVKTVLYNSLDSTVTIDYDFYYIDSGVAKLIEYPLRRTFTATEFNAHVAAGTPTPGAAPYAVVTANSAFLKALLEELDDIRSFSQTKTGWAIYNVPQGELHIHSGQIVPG